MPTFGPWTYTVDREATASAYCRAEVGGVDSCPCAPCRNFRLVRDRVFPPEFLMLLDQFGIDPRKDAEIYYIAKLASNVHAYAGWFHFVGILEKTEGDQLANIRDDFGIWMHCACVLRLPTLKDLPMVQLEFDARAVPWVLDEPDDPEMLFRPLSDWLQSPD